MPWFWLPCLFSSRYQKSTNTYAPYNKDWIKEKIYILLRRQAAKANWDVDSNERAHHKDRTEKVMDFKKKASWG